MENPIVKVEHLSHRYGGTQWAIRDISFEINQKGILGLLGSNGAGKSTTMNIICGTLNQTEGNVFINGINLRNNPIEAKKSIGFLPQKPPLHTELTVDEYLTYCAHLRSIDKDKIGQAVERVKEKCGIAHFSKRVLRNLSGGYQQRVGIAQAIIHMPKFVVLDEPTNGLDPNQIIEIRHLIKDIAQEHAILISTHILSEVQATCDEIKMIEHGNMVFSGTVSEFNNYIVPESFLTEFENPPSETELLSVTGIKSVESLSSNRFRIQSGNTSDTVKRVVKLSVEREWNLVEIQIEKSSMDTVFAHLSNKK